MRLCVKRGSLERELELGGGWLSDDDPWTSDTGDTGLKIYGEGSNTHASRLTVCKHVSQQTRPDSINSLLENRNHCVRSSEHGFAKYAQSYRWLA
jgi:hypothetical protein